MGQYCGTQKQRIPLEVGINIFYVRDYFSYEDISTAEENVRVSIDTKRHALEKHLFIRPPAAPTRLINTDTLW